MAERYVDLILCEHSCGDKLYLFQTNPWTRLEPGTPVVVETKKGEKPATVIDSLTVIEGDELFNFVVKACGASLPLKKVIGKYEKIDYQEENENE